MHEKQDEAEGRLGDGRGLDEGADGAEEVRRACRLGGRRERGVRAAAEQRKRVHLACGRELARVEKIAQPPTQAHAHPALEQRATAHVGVRLGLALLGRRSGRGGESRLGLPEATRLTTSEASRRPSRFGEQRREWLARRRRLGHLSGGTRAVVVLRGGRRGREEREGEEGGRRGREEREGGKGGRRGRKGARWAED